MMLEAHRPLACSYFSPTTAIAWTSSCISGRVGPATITWTNPTPYVPHRIGCGLNARGLLDPAIWTWPIPASYAFWPADKEDSNHGVHFRRGAFPRSGPPRHIVRRAQGMGDPRSVRQCRDPADDLPGRPEVGARDQPQPASGRPRSRLQDPYPLSWHRPVPDAPQGPRRASDQSA